MATTDEFLKPEEVAALLRISRTRTYDMLAAGTLPATRIGARLVRVRRADLERWVAEHSADALNGAPQPI